MDSEMEALDLESRQMKLPQVRTQPPQARESESHDAEGRDATALGMPPPTARQEPEAEAQRSIEAEVRVNEGRDAEALAAGEGTLARQLNQFSGDADETQLAAIRELMARASDRDVWLSLCEIAEATEFGEASISAQLRHLRKAHHGGFRVEKRRRGGPRRRASKRKIQDAIRGPMIWEYRVLPPSGAGRTGPGARRILQDSEQAGQAGSGASRTGSERRATEEADA